MRRIQWRRKNISVPLVLFGGSAHVYVRASVFACVCVFVFLCTQIDLNYENVA